jgi:adenylate cyclase
VEQGLGVPGEDTLDLAALSPGFSRGGRLPPQTIYRETNGDRSSIMPEGTRRLAAIMFTDMVGYTALAQSSETRAMEVLGKHNLLLRPFFPRFNGREVKTMGDSFLVEFESALDAFRCAVELQSFLHDYNASTREGWKITLRVGIHLGDVIHEGTDVVGDAVNIASRIEPLAEPEGVCITSQVYDQVHNKVEQGLVPLGERALKNITSPLEVYKVEMPWEKSLAQGVLDRRRLAVLPFVSISPDPGDGYFADGLTEELIGRLSLVKGLEVIARTSAMNYKGEKKNVSLIGKELKVGTILEGSVRKAGNKVRITAQLIDASTEGHLWMENYDRGLDDIFAVQSDVAERVAGSLAVKLTPTERKIMQSRQTSNPEAYACYLKGKFYSHRWDRESLAKAADLFREALSKDPNYATAYAGLSGTYSALGFQDLMNPVEANKKAREYVQKALELEPELPEARLALAVVHSGAYDTKGTEEEAKRAVELDPSFADAYGVLASNSAFRRRWRESVMYAEKELALDPMSSATSNSAGTWLLYAGEHDQAIKHLRDAIELDPEDRFSLDNLGLAYIQKGFLEEGLAMVKSAVENSKIPQSYADLAYAYVKAGKPEEARKLLGEFQGIAEAEGGHPVAIAGFYAVLGETDTAIQWLEKAYEMRTGYLPAVNSDFVFDGIRGDKRFRDLIQKMGMSPD